jgi:hypothetical protein
MYLLIVGGTGQLFKHLIFGIFYHMIVTMTGTDLLQKNKINTKYLKYLWFVLIIRPVNFTLLKKIALYFVKGNSKN